MNSRLFACNELIRTIKLNAEDDPFIGPIECKLLKQGNAIGVCATSKITKGDIILQIPKTAWVTRSSTTLIPPMINHTGQVTELSKCHDFLALSFLLFAGQMSPNKEKNENFSLNLLYAYSKTIDLVQLDDLPLFWKDAQIHKSKFPGLTTAYLTHFDELVQLAFQLRESAFPYIMNMSEIIRMLAWVKSRTFGYQENQTLKHVLIPIVDLFNHDKNEEVLQINQSHAVLKASKDYNIGEEIFISYGTETDAHYLMTYGFLPPLDKKSLTSINVHLHVNEEHYKNIGPILDTAKKLGLPLIIEEKQTEQNIMSTFVFSHVAFSMNSLHLFSLFTLLSQITTKATDAKIFSSSDDIIMYLKSTECKYLTLNTLQRLLTSHLPLCKTYQVENVPWTPEQIALLHEIPKREYEILLHNVQLLQQIQSHSLTHHFPSLGSFPRVALCLFHEEDLIPATWIQKASLWITNLACHWISGTLELVYLNEDPTNTLLKTFQRHAPICDWFIGMKVRLVSPTYTDDILLRFIANRPPEKVGYEIEQGNVTMVMSSIILQRLLTFQLTPSSSLFPFHYWKSQLETI